MLVMCLIVTCMGYCLEWAEAIYIRFFVVILSSMVKAITMLKSISF